MPNGKRLNSRCQLKYEDKLNYKHKIMNTEKSKSKAKGNGVLADVSSCKSFYHKKGFQLTDEGLKASKKMEKAIKKLYCEWLDKGYSPSECREMLLTQVWTTSTFENAMRS